jgi:hypothetical protein
MKLPRNYDDLTPKQKRLVREEYVRIQDDKCWYCGENLDRPPRADISMKPINWGLFPPGFMNHPVHLQHDHDTGLTEGAVHSLCNAYLWQYHGR